MRRSHRCFGAILIASLAAGCGSSDDTTTDPPPANPQGDSGASDSDAAHDGGAGGAGGGGVDGAADGGGSDGGSEDAPLARVTNEPPTARGETFYATKDTPATLTGLLANDVDPDGDALALTVTKDPSHGTLAKTGADEFVYTPAAGYTGEDSFSYRVTDPFGASDDTDVFIYTPKRTFYVSSAGGSDAAAGTSPATAWKTLGKVGGQFCSSALEAGDAVLLERGSRFGETLTNCGHHGAPGSPIVIGAYGTGAQPIVAGSDVVGGWTKHAGKVWKATVNQPVHDVYFDGKRQQPARLPNSGWFKNVATSDPNAPLLKGATSDLPGGANAYAGATLRLRTVNWAYDVKSVVSSSSGELTVDSPFQNRINDGDWGYFLDGKLELLDAPGEWYYDASAKTLYFEPPGDVDPSAGLVEATVRKNAIEFTDGSGIDSSFVFDDLAAKQAYDAVVMVSYENRDVVLRRLTVSDGYYGIKSVSSGVDIVESTIERTLATGVILGLPQNRVLRSTLQDIAIVPGYGEPTWGYMGLRAYAGTATIRHNRIDNVGYLGISVDGANSVVEENLVTRSLAILNDGGDIAFDNCDGLILRKNIVADAIGSYADSVSQTAGPWVSPYESLSLGIAFGNTSTKNTTIDANVVTRNGGGIAVDHTSNSTNNVVSNNLVVDNDRFELVLTDQGKAICNPTFDDVYMDNVFIPGTPDGWAMYQQIVQCKTQLIDWGTFSNNLYGALFGQDILHRQHFGLQQLNGDYTLAEWQAESGQDATSTALTPVGAPAKPVVFYNAARGDRIVAPQGAWRRLDGTDVTGPITIGPYEGVALLPK